MKTAAKPDSLRVRLRSSVDLSESLALPHRRLCCRPSHIIAEEGRKPLSGRGSEERWSMATTIQRAKGLVLRARPRGAPTRRRRSRLQWLCGRRLPGRAGGCGTHRGLVPRTYGPRRRSPEHARPLGGSIRTRGGTRRPGRRAAVCDARHPTRKGGPSSPRSTAYGFSRHEV